jgi:bromodomain-containing factor 1
MMQTGTFDRLAEDLPMEGAQEEKAADQTSTDSKPEAKADAPPSTAAQDTDHAMQDAPGKKSGRERDEDDDEDGGDRPPKRAKTADATESQTATTSTSTSTDLTGPLTPARAKFVLGVVRSLRRSKDGRPFAMPVDAEKLNIPHYYQIITKPMDLQTMERKLNSNEYTDVDTFVADFKQILANCMTFNGPGHVVTDMSLTMEGAFYRHMKDLPSEDYVEVEKPKASKKKKGGHALAGAAAASHQNKASGGSKKSSSVAATKGSKSSAQSPAATSPVFSLQPSGMPQIRRDSTAGDGRPKREIHPPAPKDLPYSTKPRRKQNAAELKFCETVLKELHRKPYESIAFPFYHPVDPVALNIPDYFKIIKKPMDLSTIQEKLKVNAYDSADDFEADIRLMFNNCYKFNPPNQPVHKMGKQLEEVFDQKWAEKPSFATAGSRSPQSASPPPHEDMSDEEEDESNQNIAELEKKLEKMKEEITAMKKGQKKKTPPAQNKNAKSKSGAAPRKGSTAGMATSSHKKKSGKKEVPYISLEQKTELSQRINLLPPQKMHYALIMIKEMMPELGNVRTFVSISCVRCNTTNNLLGRC